MSHRNQGSVDFTGKIASRFRVDTCHQMIEIRKQIVCENRCSKANITIERELRKDGVRAVFVGWRRRRCDADGRQAGVRVTVTAAGTEPDAAVAGTEKVRRPPSSVAMAVIVAATDGVAVASAGSVSVGVSAAVPGATLIVQAPAATPET